MWSSKFWTWPAQRDRCVTADLGDVAAISEAAVKTLFCYQLEQQTGGGQLTILTPPRLQRRLAVCDATPAPGHDRATDDAPATMRMRRYCPAPRPAGAPRPMRPGAARRETGGQMNHGRGAHGAAVPGGQGNEESSTLDTPVYPIAIEVRP